jgi:hypothetical protein
MQNEYGQTKYKNTIANLKSRLGLLIDEYQDDDAKKIMIDIK